MTSLQGTDRLDRLPARAALRFLSERCRGEYARLAPEILWGLQHPSREVRAEAAQCLIDLGNPAMRVAWAAYEGEGLSAEERGRVEAFLMRNADWVFERLFEEYKARPEAETVRRHAALWSLPALRNRLRAHVEGGGDAWLARNARAILGHLGEAGQGG